MYKWVALVVVLVAAICVGLGTGQPFLGSAEASTTVMDGLDSVGELTTCSCESTALRAKVGDSKDACQKDNVVHVDTKSGRIALKAGESKFFEMRSYVTEFHFYCGGSRERVANGKPFKWVNAARSNTGSIHWTFYAQ